MRTVGIVATAIAGLGALIGLALGVRSVPDLKRYLRMRSM